MLGFRLRGARAMRVHVAASVGSLCAAAAAAPSASSSLSSCLPSASRRSYATKGNDSAARSYEAGVERGSSAGAGAAKGADAGATGGAAAAGGGDGSHITKATVWGLWNEGNLFSLSVAELAGFLKGCCNVEVDPKAKKSALVRQVEEIMSAEQPSLVAATDDDVAAGVAAATGDEYSAQAGDLYEEADVYGDWGAEPGFEDRKELDFMCITQAGMAAVDTASPLAPRAFQLLHADTTADLGLARFDASKLPGCSGGAYKDVFSPQPINADDANRLRFRKAFKWCATNLWNLSLDGELNIGAGKALYWRSVAKYNRNVLPVWTCQQHLHQAHPYTWFAVAHESNTPHVLSLAQQLDMQPTQQPETSYKVYIKRTRDQLDVELNSQMRCVAVNKPWDRFLCSHVLRSKMPDLRYLVRARTPIKKKVVEAYFETDILKLSKDTVQSVLSPELGEVVYTCERVVRKWATRLQSGVTLQLVETKRIPLIVARQGEEGERLEYELIASIPQQSERVDLQKLSDDLWQKGNEFASVLEEGMTELQAHTMPSSAAFERTA